VLAATAVFLHQRLASGLDGDVDRALRGRAADVAALAEQSDTGLRDARRGPQLAQLVDASGRVLDRTAGASGRPLLDAGSLAAARRGAVVRTDVRLAGGPVRLLAQRVRAQDQALVVVVGQSLDARDRALRDLRAVLALGIPAALLLASLAGYVLTGAALRPVEAMRLRAAAITTTDLEQRLPPAGGDDELGRLGRTLNAMLDRVHASVERERTLVSDASHELRNPLAVLRTELELIARERPSGAALQAAVGSAVEETDRLSRLAEELLLLARADDHQLVLDGERAMAGALLRDAAERAGRRALRGAPRIVVEAPDGLDVLVDHDRIARAIDNLLDNAVRHAHGRVELSARRGQATVELHVADDGPGFPPDFLPHAWERFARADPARTGDGSGLGLAIVRVIAEAHGGRAHAANRAGGGADVWVSLPAPAS
jgi:signal transduction histidine kinase